MDDKKWQENIKKANQVLDRIIVLLLKVILGTSVATFVLLALLFE